MAVAHASAASVHHFQEANAAFCAINMSSVCFVMYCVLACVAISRSLCMDAVLFHACCAFFWIDSIEDMAAL